MYFIILPFGFGGGDQLNVILLVSATVLKLLMSMEPGTVNKEKAISERGIFVVSV